jgi:hypothetical protein
LIAVQLVNNSASTRKTVQASTSSRPARPPGQRYQIFECSVPPTPNGTFPIPGGPWFGSSGAFVQAIQDVRTTGNVVARVTAFQEA